MSPERIISSDDTENNNSNRVLPGDSVPVHRDIDTLALKERVAFSTKSGGLKFLPLDFDEQDGDWIVINSDNPFEVLFLDYKQYRIISPEIVKNNYEILLKFWSDKVSMMNTGGNRVAYKLKFGEKTVDYSTDKLKNAFKLLSTKEKIDNCFIELDNERIKKGESRLLEDFNKLIRDGDLSVTDFDVLFELKDSIDLADEEIAVIIQNLINIKGLIQVKKVKGKGWVPVNELQGITVKERLTSVTWMTQELFDEHMASQESAKNVIELKSNENESKVPKGQAILQSNPVKPKKSRKFFLLAIVIIIILGVIGVPSFLQYESIINVPFLNKIIHSKYLPVKGLKTFYFCYSAASVKGKLTLIVSNVFKREKTGFSEIKAKNEFRRLVKIRYKHDYYYFNNIICNKYPSSATASIVWNNLRSDYSKKKYIIRFINVSSL